MAAEQEPCAGDDDHGRDGDPNPVHGIGLAAREREAQGTEDQGRDQRPGVTLLRVGHEPEDPDRREAAGEREEEDRRRVRRGERLVRDE